MFLFLFNFLFLFYFLLRSADIKYENESLLQERMQLNDWPNSFRFQDIITPGNHIEKSIYPAHRDNKSNHFSSFKRF